MVFLRFECKIYPWVSCSVSVRKYGHVRIFWLFYICKFESNVWQHVPRVVFYVNLPVSVNTYKMKTYDSQHQCAVSNSTPIHPLMLFCRRFSNPSDPIKYSASAPSLQLPYGAHTLIPGLIYTTVFSSCGYKLRCTILTLFYNKA